MLMLQGLMNRVLIQEREANEALFTGKNNAAIKGME